MKQNQRCKCSIFNDAFRIPSVSYETQWIVQLFGKAQKYADGSSCDENLDISMVCEKVFSEFRSSSIRDTFCLFLMIIVRDNANN